jgi:hypothetical protein
MADAGAPDATQLPPANDAGRDEVASLTDAEVLDGMDGAASPEVADAATADQAAPPGSGDATSDSGLAPTDATIVGTLDASVPANDGEVFNEPPCNQVDYGAAPFVTTTYVDAAAPAMTGGAIHAGTYFMTSSTVYGPSCVQTSIPAQGVIVIRPDIADPATGALLSAGQSELGHRDDNNATYAIDGGNLLTASVCASPVWAGPQTTAWGYTSTDTAIVMESPPDSCVIAVSVYTKQ